MKTDIHSAINYITAITPPSNTNLYMGAMNYSDTTSHLSRYLSPCFRGVSNSLGQAALVRLSNLPRANYLRNLRPPTTINRHSHRALQGTADLKTMKKQTNKFSVPPSESREPFKPSKTLGPDVRKLCRGAIASTQLFAIEQLLS